MGDDTAMALPAPGSAEELAAYQRLQARLPDLFRRVFADPLEPRTVVIVPGLTMDQDVLAKVLGGLSECGRIGVVVLDEEAAREKQGLRYAARGVISLVWGWSKPLSCVRMSMGAVLAEYARPRKMPRGLFTCRETKTILAKFRLGCMLRAKPLPANQSSP